jgi:hypothetical protein
VSFVFGIQSSVGCGRVRCDHVALGFMEGNIGTRSRRTVSDWQKKPAAKGSVDGFVDGETASDRRGSSSSRFASWRIRPGVGRLVEQPGESTDEVSSWHKPNNVD